jgi:acyl-CoA synthetase (AMP-forming)/AMP-acid ligase II
VPGEQLTEDELIEFCRGRIASFKVPRYVRFIAASDWPMSASKIQKFRLREQLLEELGIVDAALETAGA